MPYTKIELQIMALQGAADADAVVARQSPREVGRGAAAPGAASYSKRLWVHHASDPLRPNMAGGKGSSPTATSTATSTAASSASSRVPSPTASLEEAGASSPAMSQTVVGSSPDSVGSTGGRIFDGVCFDGKGGKDSDALGRKLSCKLGGKRRGREVQTSWMARLWRSSWGRRSGSQSGGVGGKRTFLLRSRASAV